MSRRKHKGHTVHPVCRLNVMGRYAEEDGWGYLVEDEYFTSIEDAKQAWKNKVHEVHDRFCFSRFVYCDKKRIISEVINNEELVYEVSLNGREDGEARVEVFRV